jgi:YVTN family beta-propeller protein
MLLKVTNTNFLKKNNYSKTAVKISQRFLFFIIKSLKMKKNILKLFLLLIFFPFNNLLNAQQVNYVLDKTISLPGNDSYDYLIIDQIKRNLYVSHGTNVHVINLDSEKSIGTISGMLGNHGIAIAPNSNLGFISDGKANTVNVFDIHTLEIKTIIKLNGKKPDAIIYDTFSDKVFAFNGSSNNISVIDVKTLKEVATLDLEGAPEFAVTDENGKIYCNIEDKNLIEVIDTKNLKVINAFPLAPCGGPTGLAIDVNNNRLFTACRENKGMSIVEATTGKIINTFSIGSGVDAVAFDLSTKLIFCSNGDGTTSIFKQESADKYFLIQTLMTQKKAKTLALDQKTHKIYLSVADFDTSTKKMIPNTFKVLVYKKQ